MNTNDDNEDLYEYELIEEIIIRRGKHASDDDKVLTFSDAIRSSTFAVVLPRHFVE